VALQTLLPSSTPLRSLVTLASCAVVCGVAAWLVTSTWGPQTPLCLALACAAGVRFLGELPVLAARVFKRAVQPSPPTNLVLLILSLGVATALLELGLQIAAEVRLSATGVALSIPEEWKRRPVTVPGAQSAYSWHGKLHVHDAQGLRRAVPFRPKQEDRCRIIVLGDSLTYGYGVAEEEAYPRVLEGSLAADYRVEVLNLGVSGWQSANIASAAEHFVPDLSPDLVVYGMCLNDFLEASEGEETNRSRRAYPFPLPERFTWEMKSRTLLAEIIEERYDRLLMLLGLRLDFFDDILHGFAGYRNRFAADVARLNATSIGAGLPPVVALVVSQSAGKRARQIAAIAERLMDGAGLDVVPSAGYLEAIGGRTLSVSAWEGHPNAEAHRLFAAALRRRLDGHPALERCRIRPAPP